jgi:hypothetical protein
MERVRQQTRERNVLIFVTLLYTGDFYFIMFKINHCLDITPSVLAGMSTCPVTETNG